MGSIPIRGAKFGPVVYGYYTLVVVPGPAFVTTGFAEVTKNSITESDDDGTLVLIIEG